MNATEPDLPSSDSTSLDLLHPTPEEIEAIWRVNGQSWAGRLPMEAYVRREKLLANQDFTRDGGITWWVLVDATKPPNARPILSSCESLKKRALVARSNGRVEDVLGHGIGSVFCDPRYRNRGYATRMIHELGEKLNTWLQLDGAKTEFSVLYSDIGKVRCIDARVALWLLIGCPGILRKGWLETFHFQPYQSTTSYPSGKDWFRRCSTCPSRRLERTVQAR